MLSPTSSLVVVHVLRAEAERTPEYDDRVAAALRCAAAGEWTADSLSLAHSLAAHSARITGDPHVDAARRELLTLLIARQ